MSDNAEFQRMAQEAYAVDWVAAGCMACIVYDHFITFGQEIDRMWIQPERWSIARLIFFVNRYIVESMLIFNAIASSKNHLSSEFCKFYLRWLVCTITVTTATVEGILFLRVWAIYRVNISIVILAFCFYIGGVSSLIGLTITDYVADTVTPVDDFAVMPGCYAASVPSIIAGYWIAPVIVESLFFGLIAVKMVSWWLNDRHGVPPTLILLARDSTIYFAVIFVLLITNLFMFEYAPPFLSSLMVTPVNTAGCIAGSRMLLNLRAIASTNITENDVSIATRLRFAPFPRHRGQRHERSTEMTGSSTQTGLEGATDSGAWEMGSIVFSPAENSQRSKGKSGSHSGV